MLSAIWAVPSLLGLFLCLAWSWLFFPLVQGERRGREVLLVFFSHVSSGVKMCRIIEWGDRKWLTAPHSPAPQTFVCQVWAYCLLTCPCCPEHSSLHLAWPRLLPVGLACPWTGFLSWFLSFPLLWIELLWSSLDTTPQPSPVCRSWGWTGKWLERRAQAWSCPIKISLVSLKMK